MLRRIIPGPSRRASGREGRCGSDGGLPPLPCGRIGIDGPDRPTIALPSPADGPVAGGPDAPGPSTPPPTDMALRSTVHKADLSIADMDRGHYADHALTVARHPSETDERMMVRVLAWALDADESLAFGAGLSDPDEPDLVRKDLTGAIDLWVMVGLPDEKLVRRACGRAAQVRIWAYGGQKAEIWWSQNASALARCANLSVISLPQAQTSALAKLAARSMKLGITVQDGSVLVASDADSVTVEPRRLMPAE